MKHMNSIEHHWQQAKDLISAGNTEAALPFLQMASDANHPAACFNLGCVHLFKLVETPDSAFALNMIQKAADLHHGGALYQLAMLELSKPDQQPNWQYANECLWKSAQQRFPVALRTLGVLYASSHDATQLILSTLCLEHAAVGGDIVSLALLMHRLRNGIGCRQNSVRADAIQTLLSQSDLDIQAPVPSVHPHFAQATALDDLPDLPKPNLASALWKAPLQLISESPWVAMAENVLNTEESYLLQYLGTPHLEPSITANSDGNLVKVSLRSSYDMAFADMQEDISMLLIQRRMAALIDTTPAYSEPLHLLRYQNGQEYRPHRDYLPSSLFKPVSEGGAGQRHFTAIAYLNDLNHGGETEFIELKQKISPKLGRVLVFKNIHDDGSPDARTLHAGLPVQHCTKWIATLWIHQGVFRR
jgi:prolyl 4-hydroxylase